MVKRMRKAKTNSGGGEVAIVDRSRPKASSSPLGVKTRAKTMAIKNSSSFSTSKIVGDDGCNYLQLRSRRLERRLAPLVKRAKKNKCSPKKSKRIGGKNVERGDPKNKIIDEKEEACFGDNELQFENIKRNSRESTPSNLIVGSEAIPKTPTSSNRPVLYNVRIIKKMTQNVVPNTPSTEALEEFFAREEKMRIEKFIKKYNFDPVNEKPLEGRFEWVELKP